MSQNEKYHLENLDGLRAISILFVLIYHGAWFYLGPESLNYNPHLWHSYFEYGIVGVHIFFAISGFLITSRILQEIKVYGSFSLKNFYLKRFFRIFPPFYTYLLVLVSLSVFSLIKVSLTDILSSATFTRIYFVENIGWYTAHVWSLCVEEHFYIILSFLFFIFKSRKIVRISILSIVLIAIIQKMGFTYKHIDDVALFNRFFKVFQHMQFMIPAVIFAIIGFDKRSMNLKSWQTMILIFMFAAGVFVNFPGKYIIWPWIISLLVVASSYHPTAFLSKILSNSIFRFIGKISYGLYLWQQLFFTPFNEVGFHTTLPLAVKVLLIFTVATVSYYTIEKYSLNIGKKYTKNNF